jgi:molybdenum cofactor cytidylyltransferase
MARDDGRPRRFLSGVVLAAGASTRMGRAKQLLPLQGRPLLQHVIDAIGSSCFDEVVVVLGCHAEEVRQAVQPPRGRPMRIVVNPDHAAGQSTSLRLGLRSADRRAEAAAVFLGDEPQVSRDLIDRLARVFLAGSTPVVRPVYAAPGGGREPGHPVFLARRMWDALEGLRGDEGARHVLSRHPEWVAEVFVEGEPPADIDTWDDYRRTVDVTRTIGQ